MAGGCSCGCNAIPTLIFACSGSADVGELADQAARKMTRDGVGNMFCLAGVGGRVRGIMKSTEWAVQIVAIDGCPLNCAKECLKQASFTDFIHVQLADLGFEKGLTLVSEENIGLVADTGTARLREVFGNII